uniref:cellulose 1,4-beta-cellobiosidase (non-reducing end) n=1 Tax=uncultured symbiotic protist of Mastotermes darwiniensis TaxID=403661 RepID=A4UX08_9EUKA|nr:putative glycosyl hydrolase family7 [uncultured symbiotic protist of Mastotermes darwiniensis]BAF57428.1 putative glycosyl hydrolase family7 [uncultured symbiotic protist of Mastotermes darwiniensis]
MLCIGLISFVYSLGVGTNTAETHPKLTWKNGGQTVNGEVTVDSNWRWTHTKGSTKNCYDGNLWSKDLCPDAATCGKNCVLEGADYSGTYGVTSSGNALTLKFVTHGSYSTNVGSRLYLLKDEKTYQMFNLNGKEFTFTVDVSNLPCGLNGALYHVNMDEDGGTKRYPDNEAGAKYGTGYCDAQCPTDLKFINGIPNSDGWKPQSNDKNSGNGKYGSCCSEMDIWEANSICSAVTPHVCDNLQQTRCQGTACGENGGGSRFGSSCDPDGCDFNSWRMGNKTFYGPGLIVDTKSKFTVVTQFVGNPVTEIKRKYVQNGKVIENSYSNIEGMDKFNSVSDKFCTAQKKAFGDTDSFTKHGGFKQLGSALAKGMVLVLSLWDDHTVNMLWLDSVYPTNSKKAGSDRGPCPTTSGVPADVESKSADANVIYSDIRFGAIDSTYK